MAKQYGRLSLFDDALPIFDNPYKTSVIPDLGLSNVPAPTTTLGLQTPGVSCITNNIQTTALKGQRVFGPNDTVFGGQMNDTVKGITPEDDREHIISLYGHVKGVEREIELIKTNHLKHLDDKISHVHQDVEALGG